MATQTSCSQQPKTIGEKPLELENFDFNLNIETFIPEKYYSQEYQRFLIPANGKTVFIKRDIIYWDKINDRLFVEEIPENAKWIFYKDVGNTSDDCLAKYGEFPFRNVGFAVSLDNKIMAVGTTTPFEFKKETNDNFIQLLTDKYGKYRIVDTGKGLTYQPTIYTIYRWELNDRIIHYWEYRNAEETNYAGFFYIYKKEYADKIMKTFEKNF